MSAPFRPPLPARSAMMRPVRAPRWARFRAALIARDDPIGNAALATAVLLFVYMAVRILLAWHAGRL